MPFAEGTVRVEGILLVSFTLYLLASVPLRNCSQNTVLCNSLAKCGVSLENCPSELEHVLTPGIFFPLMMLLTYKMKSGKKMFTPVPGLFCFLVQAACAHRDQLERRWQSHGSWQ